MKSFRFIHTGDIHLDSPLKGLAGQQGAAAERIRTATRAAFDNLVSQAIEDEVDFVIIAGDLYDGDWRDYQTGLFFVKQMGRLAQAEIPVFLLYGNHDAESQITRRLDSAGQRQRVFGAQGRDIPAGASQRRPSRPELPAARHHGQSGPRLSVADCRLLQHRRPAHRLGRHGGHANYAPCAIEDLVNKGYDYWALAHVHQAAVLHERPHVVFCGNLQGRHIRESGPKGASLVAVEDGQVEEISPLHVDCVRWTHLPVPVDHCGAAADAIDLIRQAIEDAVERDVARPSARVQDRADGTDRDCTANCSRRRITSLPRRGRRLWAWARRPRGSSVSSSRPRALKPQPHARTHWATCSA